MASRLAGGPPRIRTGNLLLAGESLFQLELAAHRLPGLRRPGSQVRPSRARMSGPRSGLPLSWCSAMHLSTHKHVHPTRWCSAWTAGIEPATTGFGDQRSPRLSYVHMSDVNENRSLGASRASGFWSVLANLSRSLPGGQGYTRPQERGHAGIPLVLLVPVT
jgi:hypothetical protein